MFKFLKQKNKGFTLVETLVAISVFTMSVVAMMVILGDSLSNLTYAKRKLTATYLAQEGVEYMRNLRDTYVLYADSGEDGWVDFKADIWDKCNDQVSKGCYFNIADLPGSAFTNPSDKPIIVAGVNICPIVGSNVCPIMKYHADTGVYDYNSSGTDSGYRRRILVQGSLGTGDDPALPNIDEIRVSSTVSWTQGSGAHEITFTENLFNWTQ